MVSISPGIVTNAHGIGGLVGGKCWSGPYGEARILHMMEIETCFLNLLAHSLIIIVTELLWLQLYLGLRYEY